MSVPPHSRGRGPMTPAAAAQPLPSPHRLASHGMGAHEGMPPPVPSHSRRRGAHEGTLPHFSMSLPPLPLPLPSCPCHPHSCGKGRAMATPHPMVPCSCRKGRMRPSHPHLPMCCAAGPAQRNGKPAPHFNPSPLRPPRRAPLRLPFCADGYTGGIHPRPSLPMHARGETARPPQCPLAQATPAQPHAAHARKGRDGAPTQSLRAGDASPTTCTSHQTACARKGKGWHIQPLHMGYAGPVFTRPTPHCPAPPMDAGMVHPAQLLPCRVHLPVYAPHPGGGACKGGHMQAHTRRGSQNEGRCNPGARGKWRGHTKGVRERQGRAGRNPGAGRELHVNGGVGALEWRCEREKVMVMAGE
ncbi:hypothetical protein EDB89DRAFT_1912483 [Lactarius sanguifluus]|nr:hypothetical protein EDB89DRAFT_1912483 [Lactarius sanguifluus]